MKTAETANAVFKYALPLVGRFTLRLPAGSTLLHVGAQKNEPVLWAAVNGDPPAAHETVHLVATVTGSPDDRLGGAEYVGTVLLDKGEYVVHYFRTGSPPPA